MARPRILPGWLLVLLLLNAGAAGAQDVTVARLAGEPSGTELIVNGALDERFEAIPQGPIIFLVSRQPTWFRVTTQRSFTAADEPQLVLSSPYLAEIKAWIPGATRPTHHALYGERADRRYSTRAIVIDLPEGFLPGQAVYLRAVTTASVPMHVSVEPRDVVHRADLAHIAFRTMVLATLGVIGALAIGFWAGAGDRSFLYFAGMILAEIIYLASLGGEFRDVALLNALSSDPRWARVVAAGGVILANAFHRSYLGLQYRQPVMDRLLMACSIAMGAVGVLMLATPAAWTVVIGNVVLLISTCTLLVSAVRAALHRQRDAYFLLLSWTPILLATIMRIVELLGLIVAPAWMDRLFPASFAMAGLLLIFGLAEHMMQLRRDRDRANQLATRDALTEALSRRGVEERLQAEVGLALATRRPLSIAFIDLDRFKAINDTYGHAIGDQCLRILCQRVTSHARHRDILGRFGGDELLILMPDTPLADALSVANRIREDFTARPMAIAGLNIKSSLSIGVAELQSAEGAQAFVERADAALYASKNAGRDRVTAASQHIKGAA